MVNLEKLREGCITTFERVYYTYCDKIYFYIFKQCGSEYIADEVAQCVFVRLWEKKLLLSLNHNLESQLFRMAKNIFIDELRKAAHQRRYIESLQIKYYLEGIEDKIDYKNELELIFSHVEKLPPKRKQVFLMSRIENFSYLEISVKLSISPRTVENHISLALKQLRRFLLLFIIAFYINS